MIVLGIDQSVTESGYTILEDKKVLAIESFKPKKKDFFRILEIEDFFSEIINEAKVDAVVIEGYAYGRQQKSEMMGELGGILKRMLIKIEKTFYIIPPTQMKKFATGNGKADKTKTVVSIVRKWNPDSDNEHALESFVLALIGYYAESKEIEGLNQYELDILKEVKSEVVESVL